MSESLFFFVLILGLIPFIITLFLKRKYEVQTFPIIPFLGLVFFSSITEFVLYSFKMETNYWGRIYTFLDFLAVFLLFQASFKTKASLFFLIFFCSIFATLYLFIIYLECNRQYKNRILFNHIWNYFCFISSCFVV